MAQSITGTVDYRAAYDPSSQYSTALSQTTPPVRAVVTVGGIYTIPKRFHIERTAHGAADTATFTLPMAGNPDWSQVLPSLISNQAQNVTNSIIVEIFGGFGGGTGIDTGGLSRRFYGILDAYDAESVPDEVTFSCRSLAALLIANKITTQLSANQTTIDFVTKAAKAIGLRAITMLPKGQKPATLQDVFAADLIFGVHNLRIMDILVRTAQVDGADVWVQDDVVYYIHNDLVPRQVISLKYGTDLIDWSGKHAPQFNKNIKVEVRTYNPRTKIAHVSGVTTDADGNSTAFSSTRVATSTQLIGVGGSSTTSTTFSGSGSTTTSQTNTTSSGGAFSSGITSIPAFSSAEHYFIYKPNLTPQAADNLATTLWMQYSQFEYSAKLKLGMTPTALSWADITTVFHLNEVPLSAFNTSPKFPYFFPRTMTEDCVVSQDPTGQSTGWSIEMQCLNHRLPQGEI